MRELVTDQLIFCNMFVMYNLFHSIAELYRQEYTTSFMYAS